MSYKRLNIKNGDIINDYHINYLQDAISKISSEGKSFKERLALILMNKGVVASKEDSFEDLIFKVNSLPAYAEQKQEMTWPDIRKGIKSGHIRLLVKTGGAISFFVQAVTPAKFVIDWGDGTVNRYYVPQGGQWIEKNIVISAGTSINANYNVATIDISLDTEDSSICRFLSPSNQQHRERMLWFCSKDIVFTTGNRMFNNNSNTPCENLKYIDVIGGSINGNLEYFARWCASLERIACSFNPGVNSVIYAFDGCKSLKEPPILNLNDVTDARYLFAACTSITEFNYYINNNGSFTNVQNMFQGCTNLKRFVQEQKFDFSKVSDQSFCLADCNNLLIAPTITFGNGSARYFFSSCTSLTNVQNTITANNVSNIEYFFYRCMSLIDGPSEFYATNATNANNFFNECNNIKSVPQVLNLPKATNAQNLFKNCFNLKIAPKTINLPVATDIGYMFAGCNTLTTSPTTINAESATNAPNLFENCTMLITAPATINLPVAKNVSSTFYQCTSLVKGPDKYYAPLATDASGFFQSCNTMKDAGRRIEIANENPSGCTFRNFFLYCNSLVNLPTEGDIHKGWSYDGFFERTSKITYESFQNFCEKGLSFPYATNLNRMFYNSTNRRIPDINAPKCTTVTDLFRENPVLEEIGALYLPACTVATNSFYNAKDSLVRLGKLTLDSLSNNNMNFYANKLESLTVENLRTSFGLNDAKSLVSVRLETPNATHIGNLEFRNCNLDENALNLLLRDLPDRVGKTQLSINIRQNPGSTSCDKSIGTSKNWNVIIS